MAGTGQMEFLNERIGDIGEVTEHVENTFRKLDSQQLRWKPSQDQWSISECLAHLIKTNSCYIPQFEQIIQGQKRTSFWEMLPLLPGFWGKLIIKTVHPETRRKVKTFNVFMPEGAAASDSILQDFKQHQEKLSSMISRFDGVNLDETMITSPASKLITYSLHDCLLILALHEQRHTFCRRRE